MLHLSDCMMLRRFQGVGCPVYASSPSLLPPAERRGGRRLTGRHPGRRSIAGSPVRGGATGAMYVGVPTRGRPCICWSWMCPNPMYCALHDRYIGAATHLLTLVARTAH